MDEWFKMAGDVVDALGLFDQREGNGGIGAYLRGRSTQTDARAVDGPVVYEKVLTRPRDPRINDR